jgi:hypothetical protein
MIGAAGYKSCVVEGQQFFRLIREDHHRDELCLAMDLRSSDLDA